nr:MAG TPA_asm: hypothetical protein [Caudoviricetes sp.]
MITILFFIRCHRLKLKWQMWHLILRLSKITRNLRNKGR